MKDFFHSEVRLTSWNSCWANYVCMVISWSIQKLAEIFKHIIAHNLLHFAIKGGHLARTVRQFLFLQEILVRNRPMGGYSERTFDSTLFGWAYLSHLIKVQLPIGKHGAEPAPFAESLHCHLIVFNPKASLIRLWSSRLERKTKCSRAQPGESRGRIIEQSMPNGSQLESILRIQMWTANIHVLRIKSNHICYISSNHVKLSRSWTCLKDLTWLY